MSSLLTFSRFFSIEEAKPLTELLGKEHIVFLIEQEVNQLDPIYIGNNMDPMIVVKIPQESFRRVNDLLESRAAIEIQRADPQHYLYSFTNSELLNVLNNPEEWSLYEYGPNQENIKGEKHYRTTPGR